MEALTKQNGVRLFGKLKKKLKKKVKTDLPYLSFYKKKPETHIFFFLPYIPYFIRISGTFPILVKIRQGNNLRYLRWVVGTGDNVDSTLCVPT